MGAGPEVGSARAAQRDSPRAMEPTAKLPSAGATCLCCCVVEPAGAPATVVVGTEDGVLCWFDVEAGAKVGQADLRACCADASSSPSEAAVTSCTTSAEQQPQVVYAACGSTTHVMDLRAGQAPVQSFTQCSQDEVNQVCVNRKASHLACADDSGDVWALDLVAGKPFKRLRQAHSNMATCVAFRPHRPWELLTGGMDMTVARWDFAAGKCLGRWNLQQLQTQAGAGEQQLFNPPFVHALAVPPVPASAPRHWCQLAAAAAGDGSVVLFDVEQGVALPPGDAGDASASSKPTTAGGRKSGGSSSRKGAGGASSSSSPSSTKRAAGQQQPGDQQADEGPELRQQQQQQEQAQDEVSSSALWWADAGSGASAAGSKHAAAPAPKAGLATRVWGQTCGGHRRSAACLAFAWGGAPGGVAPSHLVSAGDDRRLLLWSLQGGAPPAASGQEEQEEEEERRRRRRRAAPHVDVAHGRKVNGLATTAARSSSSKSLLFVCDTSKRVSVYDLPGAASRSS